MNRPLLALTAMLAAAVPLPAAAQTCEPFTDVAASNAFCPNIQWMYNRAITLGCTDTTYCPSDFVRRDQMAAFLYRLGFQNAFLNGGNMFGATAVIGTTDDQALEVHANASRIIRYQPHATSPNIIAGHPANTIAANTVGAKIGGGGTGNSPNRVTDNFGTIGGGAGNRAGDDAGASNTTTNATVGGGFSNVAAGSSSTVGGGVANEANGFAGTVGGGAGNAADGQYATAPGGRDNRAAGDYSVAMGRRANVTGDGSFSFADSNDFDFTTSGNNVFRVRATGGVRFIVDIDGSGNVTWSCTLASGGSWSCSSDRALKQNLVALDGRAVLDRLMSMPVYAWNPKGRHAHVQHYGPMAQDFHAAFGLGDDVTMIGTQDADGVALSAIQGLNAKVDEALAARDSEIALLRSQVAELRTLLQASGVAPAHRSP